MALSLGGSTRIFGIALAVLLISGSFVIPTTHSTIVYATHFSSLTNQELASKLQESADRLDKIATIIDEAAIYDIANQTTLALRERVQDTVVDSQAETKLLRIVDASRTVLSNTESFLVEDLDENGSRKMLNATDNVLNAFISAVNSERGKRISSEVADDLIANATAISLILNKEGREVTADILGRETPTATQLFNDGKAEVDTIRDILAEFQSRGFTVEVDAQEGSPIHLIMAIATIIEITLEAPALALATTHAVNEALVEDGYAPLTEDEELGLYFLNYTIFAGISVLTEQGAQTSAKTFFKNVGNYLIGEIAPATLAKIFSTANVAQDMYRLLEPILIQFEKNLITSIRNLYGNKISGFVFDDKNGNGLQNPSEPGITNWNVIVYLPDISWSNSTLTVDGFFEFKGLIDGNYTLISDLQAGWINTTASSMNITLDSSDRESTGNEFLVFKLGQISGMKFNDADGDGVKDAGESGLSNWNIRLKNATTGAIVANATTNANGLYSFTNVHAGNYTIEEVQQSGYTQTSPSSPSTYSVTITSGANITSRDFGNRISSPVTVSLVASYDSGVVTESVEGSACGTPNQLDPLTTVPGAEASRSTLAAWCVRSHYEFDTSSIPDSATITSVVFKFEVHVVQDAGGSFSCNYTPIATRPSTVSSPQSAWNDIGDGTAYVTGNAACTSAGINKSVNLGTSASTDLQNQLSSNWFAVGMKLADETRTSSGDKITRVRSIEYSPPATPQPTIEVTYIP